MKKVVQANGLHVYCKLRNIVCACLKGRLPLPRLGGDGELAVVSVSIHSMLREKRGSKCARGRECVHQNAEKAARRLLIVVQAQAGYPCPRAPSPLGTISSTFLPQLGAA